MADRCYLIATDDGSEELAATRKAGFDLAESDGAAVVLFDRTSESLLTDPYPAGPWSDEDDAVSPSSELDRETLDHLGRHYLADQVGEAQDRGLEVYAHMGQGSGADAIAEAVQRYGCSVVILPESAGSPSLADRVRGNTIDKLRKQTDADIRLADTSGTLREA